MAPTVTPLSPLTQPLDLLNKSVLVTGGATGLGLATVHAIAAAGAHVTIVTNVPVDQDVLHSLKYSGSHVQEVICDVSNWDSILGAFKTALAFSPTGTLDVVAMFAGVDRGSHLVDQIAAIDLSTDPIPPKTTELDVNLRGALYTTTLALHYFRLPPKGGIESAQARDKSLIFVASLAGYIDDTHNSVYTASKFGMRGLWRGIRARAASEMGVRCNLIAPWAIKTPMTAPILQVMDQMGIKEGAGITFASEETVVDATMRCIGDKDVSSKYCKEDVFGVGNLINASRSSLRYHAGGFLQHRG
jgi:5'-hydroxyaverantin dehydrogenase